MSRRVATVAAATGAFTAAALALGLPAGADDAAHFLEPVAGDTIACAERTYTIVAGDIRGTVQESATRSGGWQVHGTFALSGVEAVADDGLEVSAHGVQRFGARGHGADTSVLVQNRIELVAEGTGVVDSVVLTLRVARDGTVTATDFGTCAEPGG